MEDKDKVEILKTFYLEHRKEIFYFRDNSFKVMSWVIGVYLTISGATLFSSANTVYLIAPFIGLAIATHMYIHKNYNTYCDRWKRLSETEEALGCFENGFYLEGKSLLPKEKNGPIVTYKGTLFCILAVWIVALSSSLAAWLK